MYVTWRKSCYYCTNFYQFVSYVTTLRMSNVVLGQGYMRVTPLHRHQVLNKSGWGGNWQLSMTRNSGCKENQNLLMHNKCELYNSLVATECNFLYCCTTDEHPNFSKSNLTLLFVSSYLFNNVTIKIKSLFDLSLFVVTALLYHSKGVFQVSVLTAPECTVVESE